MLNARERKSITEIAGHYPSGRAASVEALKLVQEHYGHVSDAALPDVADLLGISIAELESVATFYNFIFRKPVGRHVVVVCDSISCWITGGTELRQAVAKELGVGLGETTEDGRFTLLPVVCLGACERAPAMMIDDDLHGPVASESISDLLEGYR